MPPPNPLADVTRLLIELCESGQPAAVSIRTHEMVATLTVTSAMSAIQPATESLSVPVRPSKCAADILRILREVGKPLTRTALLSEMAKRGIEWSDRSLSSWLSRMVNDGVLLNNAYKKPCGYRLTEWEPVESEE
jgi:Ribonuclease R winged-helix domain